MTDQAWAILITFSISLSVLWCDILYFFFVVDVAQDSPERQIVTIYQAQDTGLETGDPTTLEVVVTEDELLEPPVKKQRKDDTLGKPLNHEIFSDSQIMIS